MKNEFLTFTIKFNIVYEFPKARQGTYEKILSLAGQVLDTCTKKAHVHTDNVRFCALYRKRYCERGDRVKINLSKVQL